MNITEQSDMNRYTLAMSYNEDGTLKESKMVPVSKEDSPDQYNYFRADMVKAETDKKDHRIDILLGSNQKNCEANSELSKEIESLRREAQAEIDELTATIAEYKKALDRADGEVAKVTSTAFKEWTIEERKQADAEIAELKKINKFITEGSNRALKIQQAEIDAMSAGLVKAHDAFIEGDMDEVYHQIYTLMVAHDVHNPRACKNFIEKHKGE